MMKLLGALMILIGCGGVGFSMVAGYRRQENALQQLIRALEYMQCELEYRMTPLPILCSNVAQVCSGCVRDTMMCLSMELETQITPNATSCMHAVVSRMDDLPDTLQRCLLDLGDSLGRFDLSGQLQGLSSIKKSAEFELDKLRQNRDVRVRSYQTLGLCAGAALAVLFL
jgi:stage III sporulation protein AB